MKILKKDGNGLKWMKIGTRPGWCGVVATLATASALRGLSGPTATTPLHILSYHTSQSLSLSLSHPQAWRPRPQHRTSSALPFLGATVSRNASVWDRSGVSEALGKWKVSTRKLVPPPLTVYCPSLRILSYLNLRQADVNKLGFYLSEQEPAPVYYHSRQIRLSQDAHCAGDRRID